jgi:hypothetical protein
MAGVEAKAVAYGRRHVRRLKSGEISAQPLERRDSEGAAPWSWFGRENSRAWVKARLMADAGDPQRASYVCRLARDGLSVADEALREIIVEHKERDEKLFTSLRAYDIEIMRTGRRPRGGWDASELVLRDLSIVQIVRAVCDAFDLPPTRSRASRRDNLLSGCYITSCALREEGEAISESAVVKAWTRHGALVA